MSSVLSRLMHLIDLKEADILKIMEKTRRQQIALSNDNIEEMLEITELKQQIINNINQLDEEFEDCYRNLENKENASQLKEKITRIHDLMEQVAQLEAQNKKTLISKMNDVKKNIQKIKTGKKGMNAYLSSSYNDSMYIDHKN